MNPSVAAAPKTALEHWRHRTTARCRNRRCPLARTSAWRRGDGGAGGNGSAGDAGGQCCSASARAITDVRSGDYVRHPSHAGGKASAKMCGAETCCASWRHYDSMPMSMLRYAHSAHSLSAAATATARTSGSVWWLPKQPRHQGGRSPRGALWHTRFGRTERGARHRAYRRRRCTCSGCGVARPSMERSATCCCAATQTWSQLSKRIKHG